MFGPSRFQAGTLFLTAAALLICTGTAAAYVGPGAGLELIGYSLGLLSWILIAFSAVALWPIRAFIRWIRGGKPDPAPEAATAPEEQSGS
jgi:hypothetical protein